MKTGLIIAAIFITVIGIFVMSSYEKHTGTDWVGTRYESTWEYLMDLKNVSYTQSSTGTWTFVLFNTEYFKTWLKVLTFDFTFFNGGLEILRWIVFMPCSVTTVFFLAYGLIQLVQGFIPFT